MAHRLEAAPPAVRYVRRFGLFERVLHGFLMFSFLGLAATGLPLFFSEAPWAARQAHALGGFEVTSVLHRIFATIMISVFLSFVASPQPTVKMIGLGLAAAVFVDATLVRLVLVPATMELLGKANWWFPSFLEKALPHIDVDQPDDDPGERRDPVPGPGVDPEPALA